MVSTYFQKLNALIRRWNYQKFIKISFPILIGAFLYAYLICKAVTVLSFGKSSPFFPFDMFSKCHVVDDTCPNGNITFWLYTR